MSNDSNGQGGYPQGQSSDRNGLSSGYPQGQYYYPAGQGYYQSGQGYYPAAQYNYPNAATGQPVRPYSLPRRLWRIIYPVLVFIAVQFIIAIAVGLVAGLSIVFRELLANGSVFDEAALFDELMLFVTDKMLLIALLTNVAGLAVFIPIWLKTRKGIEKYRNNHLVLIAILVISFFAGFNIIQMFIFSATDVVKYFPSYDDLSEYFTGGSFLIQVLAIGVVAPVIEELVFRGILINRMKWLPVWASVLIQAAMFGVAHLNLFQGLYAFIAGILLGLIYIKYRSIILVILGHMSYNLVSVLMGEYMSEDAIAVFLIILAAGAAATVVCAILLIRKKGAAIIVNT